jgi:putative sigma-54 modulation protein
MIAKLEVATQRAEMTPELERYISRKIGRLDRFVARTARQSIHAEVKLKEEKADGKKQFSCGVVLHLPHDTLDASETTINMFAAVDIVETKLRHQLRKYKDTHTNPKFYRKMFKRFQKP